MASPLEQYEDQFGISEEHLFELKKLARRYLYREVLIVPGLERLVALLGADTEWFKDMGPNLQSEVTDALWDMLWDKVNGIKDCKEGH